MREGAESVHTGEVRRKKKTVAFMKAKGEKKLTEVNVYDAKSDYKTAW